MAQVSYGTITITDTTDIEQIYMVYAGSGSNITPPDVNDFTLWKTDITQTSGIYIWQRVVVKKSGIEITAQNFQQFYGEPVCVTGEGGRSIKSITTYYCNYGTDTPDENYNGWNINTPEYDEDKPNYWVKTVIIYVDDSEEEFESSGSIVTIEDGEHKQVTSLSISLTPIQDLHGYDKPWVGGAGKNKINVADISTSTNFYYVEFGTGYELTADQTYTFSADVTSNIEPFTLSVGSGTDAYAVDILSKQNNNNGRVFITFTPTSAQLATHKKLFVRVPRYTTQQSLTATIKNIQLEFGSTASSFEPYSNICPISGRTECVTEVCGKNLFSVSIPTQATWAGDSTDAIAMLNSLPIGTYTLTSINTITEVRSGQTPVDRVIGVWARNTNIYAGTLNCRTTLTQEQTVVGNTFTSTVTFTIDNDSKGNFTHFYLYSGDDKANVTCTFDIQIELGSTSTSYEPYNGTTHTTALGRTVYGGTLDVVSGELVVDRAKSTLDQTYTWSVENGGMRIKTSGLASVIKHNEANNTLIGAICDKFEERTPNQTWAGGSSGIGFSVAPNGDVAFCQTGEKNMGYSDWITFVTNNPIELCYPLATPQTYQLTPTEVALLKGHNNVWSDGNISVSGFTITGRDIQIHLDNGLTNALEKSADAQSKATNALGKANEATQAVALMGGHFIYKSSSSGNSTPAGAGVIQNIADNPANWGYNTWIGANGIQLRRGETADATLSTNGLVLNKGGIIGGTFNNQGSNNRFVYLSTNDYGTSISINGHSASNWREIIGTKFGVDSEGNLYASNANISGAITATSLTISDGNSTYSGISAINASGYTIEIINNASAKPSGTTLLSNQTYLYPIMRRNGEVVNYLLTSDTTRESGKSYYIRTYDSSTQTYTYALVSNPSGNPQAQSYYEAIDKTLYIWTYNDIQPGVHGDSHLGGIVATYNRTYRVSYALSDDEVGQATSSQIIEVDPQKYITQINEYGIKIHPEIWTNQSNYIQLDGTGMEVFEISQTDVSVAFFGANGSRIGAENTSNVITTPNGIAVRDGLAELAVMSKDGFDVKTYDANDNEVVIAHLGFGPGTDSGGGISDAPYYTLGTRVSGSTVGNYSHAEGYNTIASAYCAHAEGGTRSVIVSPETIASGEYSHAEGGSTTASAGCSHAEGYATVASGPHSHAEGFYTTAEGTNSHAGGCGTTVRKFNQTAIGEYNEIDNYADTHGKYAFIIGNGTSNNARSNALTVNWNGNTTIAGTLTQSSDRRLKIHQSYLSTDAINFIQNLKPAYFKKDNQSHVGFYAQDIEEIDPWNCMIGEMNGYKTLGYTEIIAPLVTYCQHLEERIRQLEEK